MTVVRVNPPSVRQYGAAAQQQFDTVRAQLQGLVDDAVGVRYFGPNAVEFKTRAGQMATDLASKLGQDLARIADAIRTSTSSITGALGGPLISISVNGSPVIAPPVAAGDESVELDPAALDALKPVVTRHINEITTQLDAHMTKLQATDWEGQAKDNAVSAVRNFTSLAKTRATEANTSIIQYIDSQVEAIKRGDQ